MESKFNVAFLVLTISALVVQGHGGRQSIDSIDKPQKLVGGKTPLDLEDERVRNRVTDLARFAVREINARSNNLYRHSLIRIQRAYSQIVAGVLYHITFYSGQSTCRNTGEKQNVAPTFEKCPLSTDENAQYQLCSVKVFEQAWLNNTELSDFKCSSVDRETALASNLQQETFALPQSSTSSPSDVEEDILMWPRFRKFMNDYNKTYPNNTEAKSRYQIFKVNMKTAKMLQDNEAGTAKYGATIFADMTPDEFTKNYLTPEWKDTGYPPRMSPSPLEPIPDKWDWRQKNVVTDVKNQGSCGSCWAFCTTANIEGVWAIKKGKLVSLSEQQLVDCDALDEGCNGGLPSNAYKEILRMGGLESESDYPYKGNQKQCHNNRTLESVYINSSVALPQDEIQMAQYLYKNGPLAIGLNANPLMFYFGGIAHPWKFLCSPKSLNHGVTIVGYGVQGDKKYWLIKNSWGKWWGESGYFRLYRGDGTCGVDQMVTSVIIDK